MPTFHILYLRESVLDHAEEAEVRDLLDAIDLAMMKMPYLTAEIWRNGARVGLVGPLPGKDPGPLAAADPSPDHESEIAEEMKVRLRMVH